MLPKSMLKESVYVREVSADDVYPLRRQVLRNNDPRLDIEFEGDRSPDTVHFASYYYGKIIGVATYMPLKPKEEVLNLILSDSGKSLSDFPQSFLQLRGMATDPEFRGINAGRQLLEKGMSILEESGGGLFWMNARTPALGFYQKRGFKAVGEEFFIEYAGPHYIMYRFI
ncbi:MAG: GNAT family N-acetyltransferase [Candidatus Kapaibacteriales bacterium]